MKSPIVNIALIVAAFALGWWANAPRDGFDDRLAEIDRKITTLAEAVGAELEEPEPAKIDLNGSPSRGAEDASVVIVEFTDFQCPYCLRAHPTMTRLLEEYPDDLKIVFKHFPLSFHEQAVNAHRAVLAAREQGKFWEMHDRIFANPKQLEEADMMAHAEQLGLDREAFETVFHSDEVQRVIDRDVEQGRAVGVRGTPAFFINGRYVAGAQPYAVFKQLVDEELTSAES